MYRVIPDEDYDQIIISRFSRIFDDYIHGWFDQPFINKTWEIVLIPDVIWLGRAEFKDREKIYINSTITIYRALIELIMHASKGSLFAAKMPFERLPEGTNYSNLAVSLDAKSFLDDLSKANEKERYFDDSFTICDETETWGYASHIDYFSFLGGTSEFMEKFFALCGGRDFVRQTFHEYDISTDWPYSFEDGAFPAWHRSFDDPNVPRTETVREFVYHSVGWEAPLYTEEEIRNHFYGLGPDDPTPPYPQDPFRG